VSDKLTPSQLQLKHRKSFEAFWSAYPRKVAPREAERIWADMAEFKGLDTARVIQAARDYASRCGDLEFVPAPHRWLQQGRYDDADLFSDEKAQELTFFRQCWKTANIRAVENRYHVTMPKQYPPDDMTNPADIEFWYRATCQAWIVKVAEEKGHPCQTSASEPMTNLPSKQSSDQSSSTQECLAI
jgi:hypothetical protein